jgi:hypothetical protein
MSLRHLSFGDSNPLGWGRRNNTYPVGGLPESLMHLSRVVITNFRSIENATITFIPACRVLVGINESGKSNILRALSLLDPNVPLRSEDIREALPTEDGPVADSRVRFIFQVMPEEQKEALAALRPGFVGLGSDEPIVADGKTQYTLEEWIARQKESLWVVDLKNKRRQPSYWGAGDSWKLCEGWYKPTPTCPKKEVVPGLTPVKVYQDIRLIKIDHSSKIPRTHFVPATIGDLQLLLHEQISLSLTKSIPKVIFWSYSDSNLLPDKVDMALFASNPDSCVPLKILFLLAGERGSRPKSLSGD